MAYLRFCCCLMGSVKLTFAGFCVEAVVLSPSRSCWDCIVARLRLKETVLSRLNAFPRVANLVVKHEKLTG